MFPDASGYALGTVEGRVAIQYVHLFIFLPLSFMGYTWRLCETIAYVLWVTP